MGERCYNWKEAISVGFIIAFLTFFVLMIVLATIHAASGEGYTSNKVVDCNDEDGDVIEGLVCHEEILCSDILRFLNEDECENFIDERGDE